MQMTLSSVDSLDNGLESFSDRSISFGKDDSRIPYNGRESEPTLLNCCGSKMMIVENSYSFKEIEPETNGDGESTVRLDRNESSLGNSPRQECGVERYHAAVKLQKTYKSFRTRRQLADCAVLVEQRWWKLLEFAELRRNSVSFFDDEKPETAVSRWSRARTKAAKVGKGLSKDERARQLALQHWLEAIDPRHRYGHNLQFYYVKWLQCENNEPFFYWLDIGEGREVTHEKCTRSKLQQQCIKYLGPMERKEFEVRIDDGKFIYNQSGLLLDTRGGPEDTKWIFVLSVSKILYVGRKKKGKFQHSSFLAGGATLSAGRLIVEDGILKTVWPHSGHYLPTQENFDEFMSFLQQHNVDLSVVQQVPRDEDDEKESSFLRISVSEPDIKLPREETKDTEPFRNSSKETGIIYKPRNRLPKKISFIQIPPRDIMMELFDYEKQLPKLTVLTRSQHAVLTPTDGYKTAKDNLTETEFSVSKVDDVTQEGEHENENALEKRIHSHKGMKSYKLAQQLSSRWSTGAGPRIGFVRDYPPELQFRALEEVSLSPRSSIPSPSGRFGRPSPRLPTSSNLCRKTTVGRSNLASEPVIVIDTVI